ncbi:ABC transporter permease subunit [Gordonia pseudamarae]|jgi:ABC-2 type transport system permease protein|uniref:Transport permease protein n=1 Tax=Gordonia pseudamarae TaxID=2831662 RepID=A0ABX6IKA8_9ACTN|nr:MULTISPECIES: ABC transporter permease [Gordonia]MBD0021085.1 ABC transporter permease [Gordonia sp. (in: high G+C Gram-positive bacteria)]QHN27458.1 ABC transporter permease subunit [Gordonia pseudamarae]QHN36342.1 ABC transporter permease subunit [Gordonia pseudamarae]
MTIMIMPAPADAPPEGSLRALISQAVPLIGRQLIVWTREPVTMLQSILMPALSMVMLKVVLGDSIELATGQNSAYRTVPMIVLIGSMFGSMVAGIRLNNERATGLLSRLYVMPISRGADLTARIVSELIRIIITTCVLLAVGSLIGFRFPNGIWTVLPIIAVAFMYAVAFAMMVLAVSVSTRPGVTLVPYLSLLSSVMMFFNTGFVPLEMYPEWLQPIVKYQPMSPAVETMKSLSLGGPVTEHFILVVIWSVVILGLSIYPALRGYHKAASGR